MKIKTRLLCTLLVIIMTACAGFAVHAANPFTDVTKYSEAIDTLYGIGVITGATGTTYNPEGNVTRWQMALLVSKLVTGEATSYWENIPSSMQFSDVVTTTIYKHYPAAIYYASQKGIIKGVGGDLFDPDSGIKYQDGLIMALRALGYYTDNASASGLVYPDDYIAKARALGLTEGLSDVSYTATLTRGQTAQVLYNAYTAKMANGSTISESIFGYEEGRIVLVATDNLKIFSNAPFAKTGKLVFSTLNAYGSLASNCFELDASLVKDIFNTTDYNAYIGTSFNVKYRNNYAEILEFTKNSTPTTVESGLSVSSNIQNKITLNNTQYQTVSNYSERLIDKAVPTSHEIIVYAVNDAFTSGSVIIASQMSGTTAYYKLTTFDDNNDGYPDRAVYKPYSFGVYTVTDGKISLAGNLPTSSVTITNTTGASLTSGVKVLYSYDSQTKELEIKKIYTEASGTVASYMANTSMLYVTPTNYSSYTSFNLGNDELNGAVSSSKLKEMLATVTAGTAIKYITDESSRIIWLELANSSNGTGSTGTTYSSDNFYIVRGYTYTNAYMYPSVTIQTPGGTTSSIYISSINGSSAFTATSLAVGDVIQINTTGSSTTTQIGAVYAVNNISAAATYNTTSVTSYITVQNSMLYVYDNNAAKYSIAMLGTIPVYQYANGNVNTSSITAGSTGTISLGTNISVFVVKSNLGVSMLYIRPVSASTTLGNTGAFTTVGYYSSSTTFPTQFNGYYLYTMADMYNSGAAIQVQTTTILPSAGLYLITTVGGVNYCTVATPVTTNVTGTNLMFVRGSAASPMTFFATDVNSKSISIMTGTSSVMATSYEVYSNSVGIGYQNMTSLYNATALQQVATSNSSSISLIFPASSNGIAYYGKVIILIG
ncbi:MAG: S-layer homology domain-containing protein [Eubacteriales bacterium]